MRKRKKNELMEKKRDRKSGEAGRERTKVLQELGCAPLMYR